MENPLKEIIRNATFLAVIQGFLFIILGVISFIHPKVLVALAAAAFLATGIVSLYYGWRIRNFSKKAEKFWKKFGGEE
ncbi:hypothetical protein KBI33_01265 [Candidatus Shapirobacteria bacterium]|nr:hypothetical protein [Candidatus Shapirobacteria bacterium]